MPTTESAEGAEEGDSRYSLMRVIGRLAWSCESDIVTRIFVVGSYVQGLTIRVPRMPVLGESLAGHSFDMGPGGKGSNQAIAAGRRGADVELLACLGDDSFGEQAGGGGLAGAAGTAKQVGMADAPADQGVAQGAGDMLLAHDIVESQRTPFEIKSLLWQVRVLRAARLSLAHGRRAIKRGWRR